LTHLSETTISTFFVFALFLSLLFVFKKLTPKFPGAITLSPFGILLGYLATAQKLPFSLATLGSKFPDISAKLFIAPHIYFNYSLIVPAIGVALIAIIETGISAKIADGITGTKHNEQKEIFGLSIANIISGLAGGIPATAALARTSLNMKSGANHKTSGMLNALSILVISFIFLKYFVYIPMAVIASILVFTAYQLIEKEPLKHMWTHNKFDFVITALVAFICIYKDTIYGIAFGLIIYLFTYLNKKYEHTK
jgi:SulP family sulfate permease